MSASPSRRRRRERGGLNEPQPRQFVIEAIEAENGTGIDDDGNPVTKVLRLELRGRWTGGQVQTISTIIALDAAGEFSALIDRAVSLAKLTDEPAADADAG